MEIIIDRQDVLGKPMLLEMYLDGELHTRAVIGDPPDNEYLPMCKLLAKLVEDILVLTDPRRSPTPRGAEQTANKASRKDSIENPKKKRTNYIGGAEL